jgi:hypothetical protein
MRLGRERGAVVAPAQDGRLSAQGRCMPERQPAHPTALGVRRGRMGVSRYMAAGREMDGRPR